MVTIYALSDPRVSGIDAVRYIGVTSQALNKRMSVHLSTARRCADHRGKWIASILRDGIRPTIEALEQHTDSDQAFRREIDVIAWYRERGARLTNTTDGGEGALGRKHTEEAKLRISMSKKGVRLSPEHVAAVSAAQRGRMPPPHVISASIARFRSDEHKKKVADAQRTPEIRKRKSLALLGKPKSAEHGRKVSAALTGRRLPQAQRDQMVARNRSPEYRAWASDIKRQWWAAKKASSTQVVVNV